MRLVFAIAWTVAVLHGQTCPPGALLPNGQVSVALDAGSCQLSDGTPYAAFRLTLPVRGQMQLTLKTTAAGAMQVQDSGGAWLASGANIQTPLEAGSYTVVVNGLTAGQAGDFSVQSVFTAEAGMLCSRFPALGVNQTIAGTLGGSGCVLPDGTAYEAYSLATLGSGTLSIDTTSSAFTPTVMLRTVDGFLLSTAEGGVKVAVDSDAKYQVLVTGGGKTGDYQLVTSFQANTTETCVPRKALTQSDSDSTAIDGSSCMTVAAGSGDLAYYNYYSLTVGSAGLAGIRVTSSDFHPTIYVADAAGNALAVDSLGGGGGQSELRLQLTPGSYLVQVFSDVGSGGYYALTYTFTEGAPQVCQASPMALGTAVSGLLSQGGCRTSLGLSDLYTVTLEEAGLLSVDVTTGSFSGLVAIRDTKENLLTQDRDVKGLGVAHVSALLPAGKYAIVAGAISGSGPYQLTPAFTAKAVSPCGQTPELNVNSGYIQSLGGAGCTDANGQPADFYKFTLPEDGVIAAVMTSNQVAGMLTLTDSAGNRLRSDRDSYGYNDPFLVQFLRAGTYQLAAGAASGGGGGLYQLSLLATLGPRPPFCAPAAALALGSKISGTLNYASCPYPGNTFADLYPVTLESDTTIDMKLTADAFDAYLLLLDAQGNVLTQDDDSGGGTDARLVQKLTAGTYFVVAKPFSDYYPVGGYTLSLQQSQQ